MGMIVARVLGQVTLPYNNLLPQSVQETKRVPDQNLQAAEPIDRHTIQLMVSS
tara:strand:- start:282 stop:440 length:159 start_codon:yes stop_codon:yes gene_type:complete